MKASLQKEMPRSYEAWNFGDHVEEKWEYKDEKKPYHKPSQYEGLYDDSRQ
jgi:hypothetical protein